MLGLNRGFIICRRSMSGGDDPHAANDIATLLPTGRVLPVTVQCKKPAYKRKPRGGTNRPGLSRVNEVLARVSS